MGKNKGDIIHVKTTFLQWIMFSFVSFIYSQWAVNNNPNCNTCLYRNNISFVVRVVTTQRSYFCKCLIHQNRPGLCRLWLKVKVKLCNRSPDIILMKENAHRGATEWWNRRLNGTENGMEWWMSILSFFNPKVLILFTRSRMSRDERNSKHSLQSLTKGKEALSLLLELNLENPENYARMLNRSQR
jgi:hypothetical protein